jgi:acetyltransferase-like isoleucine patch superfamily enzyme
MRRAMARLVHSAWETAGQFGAIGPDHPQGQRFGHMGRGACLLFPQGAIYNEDHIHIGSETIVGPHASITAGMAPGQIMPTNPVVSIGSRCIIGRGSHIVGHWSIELGDDIQTGPYVYITDQNHSYVDPVEPIGRQWPTEAAVSIGSGSWLGANVVILPGAQIGEHVVVAAGAVVRGTIPDRCVVGGVPARILRRWVEGAGWVDEKDAVIPD